MTLYRYKARKSPSEVAEGTIEAMTQNQAIDKLNHLGLFPMELEELKTQSPKQGSPAGDVRALGGKKVPAKELTALYRQLARFLHSGIPLVKALAILSEQTGSPVLAKILSRILQSVREGKSISESWTDYPQVFSSFERAMVVAGESAGALDDALAKIAQYREEQAEITGKVQSAVVYPSFIVLVGIGTVLFMLMYVLPKFSRFFEELGQDLPLATRILIALSDFLSRYGLGLLAGAAVGLLMLRGMKKNTLWIDRAALKIPKIGKILMMGEIARFSRVLELLLRSGISLTKAITMSLSVLQNAHLRGSLRAIPQAMQEGSPLSDALMKIKVFPPFVPQVLRIGEESGKLEEALADIADWYEKEIAAQVKLMTQFLEPAMILAVGLLVGYILVASLMPIFSLNTAIS